MATQTVSTINPKALSERKQRGESINLIDVRTPVEYREVHIEFARNVPLDQLNPTDVLAGHYEDEPLYVICRSGKPGGEGVRCHRRGRVSQRRKCRGRYAGVGRSRLSGCPWQESDLAGASGPHRRGINRVDRCPAGVLCQHPVCLAIGLHRSRLDLRRHHRHLWHGHDARQDAVESGEGNEVA